MAATARKEMWGGAVVISVVATCAAPHGGADATFFALSQRLAPAVSFAPTASAQKPPATVQQKVAQLRDGGMPISAIAEVVGVERKTIYSWLNGAEVRGANAQRLEQVHALLTMHRDLSARDIYRFWNSTVDGNKTLRDLMTASEIDTPAVIRALRSTRPAALKAAASERKMGRSGAGNGVLDEIPEAEARLQG